MKIQSAGVTPPSQAESVPSGMPTPPQPRRLSFTVPGDPKPQGRPRFTTRGGFPRAYDPKTSVEFKRRVATSAKDHAVSLLQGGIRLSIIVFVKRPKALTASVRIRGIVRHIKRGDCDNFSKAVQDALTGIAYKDDGQVCVLEVQKFYCGEGEEARTVIEVESIQ